MSRLPIPTKETAPAASQPLLDAVQQSLGSVPNLFRLMSLSPPTLEGFLGLHGALGKTLDLKARQRIAIAVAEVNGCDYCLSAHTYIALNLAKMEAAELELNRQGRSNDPHADEAVRFAAKVAESRGKVEAADLAALRGAGYTDAQIIDIVANVAINVMTNFINNVADTDIDFPVLRTEKRAA